MKNKLDIATVHMYLTHYIIRLNVLGHDFSSFGAPAYDDDD